VDDNIVALRRELASHAAHTDQRFTSLETKLDLLIETVRVRFDDHERRLTRLETPN
jgi:hypothetical protein